ncbi:hypothetical protein EJ03DRAFT_343976 [Teratosphaeria nubilosa]|uniref:Enhancer of polycomb-like protein n=1 Tax=Teratosphaeria nubilosa TaxID=161662 RepID=A0A6G1L784_9PEZI|nr:hypothetical protein EJ03DRAFT_343976 [Teratosphaeria nubilosa]
MSTTRATNARHVRQRKLNTKQGLRIIRESEIEDQPDESQQLLPSVETGVEKGEEIEYHLQAVINASNAAALGAKSAKQNYIPTPDAVRAKDVNYDALYPKVFKEPATYIRFSSTVEDCIGCPYCMDDDDVEVLAKLNDGNDFTGHSRKDKLGQCSEDIFEEVMNFFEETSARLQPFANVDNAPILSLEEMERNINGHDDGISQPLPLEAQKWLRPIYDYWASKKTGHPQLMPAIKVRVLDTANEADDSDPYVCFRRREVRQTRKTRGRDAQVVEKLKKLRNEMEQARQLLQMVNQREKLNMESLVVARKVFNERKELKKVKVAQNIVGDKGDDEELLVDQKRIVKPKARPSTDASGRPGPTIRLRSGADSRSAAPDNDLAQLEDFRAEADAFVINTIEARKEQHKKWNQHWVDETKYPITPPPEPRDDPMLKWASFPPEDLLDVPNYPTPPPSLPSRQESQTGDVEMVDAPVAQAIIKRESDQEPEASAGAEYWQEPQHIFHIPVAFPESDPDPEPEEIQYEDESQQASRPYCRLRMGRGGRMWLESRKRKPAFQLSSDVVSDADSDDEDYTPAYFPVNERNTFDYRVALNRTTKNEAGLALAQHQAAMAAAGAHGHPQPSSSAS